jgi:hypothetical protein
MTEILRRMKLGPVGVVRRRILTSTAMAEVDVMDWGFPGGVVFVGRSSYVGV